ncbi:hypothetical protein CFB41_32990 [Burkholderia sp. AU33803]|nr:hypothetical protein CFB41_32990 [Burkholderia sp. AU33803]PRD92004.1 hypothetical protein C6P88_17285 [Burkholderia contaminans]
MQRVACSSGVSQPPAHDGARVVMENCMNIQYSVRRNRAAHVSPWRPRAPRLRASAAAFRHRALWLTHSDGQANCHPAI